MNIFESTHDEVRGHRLRKF